MSGPSCTALDLLLPRNCIGCSCPGSAWCTGCRPVASALRVRLDGLPVTAATVYAGPTRAALLSYKERGRRDLADPLADLLVRAITALPTALAGSTALVPVPTRGAAVRARGGDHLLRLARRAGHALRLPVEPALIHTTAIRDSAGLDRANRAANLHGAVRARPGTGHAAVVVDDIATSGASLRAAFAALRAAGWHVVGGAVVAATPAPGDPTRRRVDRARGGSGQR